MAWGVTDPMTGNPADDGDSNAPNGLLDIRLHRRPFGREGSFLDRRQESVDLAKVGQLRQYIHHHDDDDADERFP